MPVVQSTPRASFVKQAALANRLNARRQVAPHISASTYFDIDGLLTESVNELVADETVAIGSLIITAGQQYFLVASKFAGCFYAVRFNEETHTWQCSASDERVKVMVIRQVLPLLKQEVAA